MREMKDSGIAWIGKIPSEWDIVPFRAYVNERVERNKGNKTDELLALSFALGVTLYKDKVYNKDRVKDDFEDYKIVHKNDLVLSPNDIIKGSIYVSQYYGCISPMYYIFESRYRETHNLYYLSYLLRTKEAGLRFFYIARGLIGSISDNGKYVTRRMTVSRQDLLTFKVLLPPIKEQYKIVTFLDSKCAEIDALSTDIQSEIETLDAYKRSKVFDTVVHGIDRNDFIQTDSDVWSTIPTGWKLVDIKYIFEIVKRIAGKEGYDVIAITQQGLKYKDITSNEGQLASDYSGYQFVYPGDYAMNHMDLLTGWVDLSDKFGVTSPDYRVFRLRYPDFYDRKYYKYIMQCCYMNRIFYSLGQGVSNLGRWRLQTSAFNNFKVPVPPYEEQVKIGNYLDEEISEINSIIAQKQEQLTVLADYKKSIIYEYVTGKKEVPAV